MASDLWTYNESIERPKTLDGFDAVALDGDIGKIDEATYDVGASYIVVDTGPLDLRPQGRDPGQGDRAARHPRREGLSAPEEGPDQGLA